MQIYISRAAADEDLARGVVQSLKASGFKVWDQSEVYYGDNWGEKVGDALKKSKGMVVLLTPNSLRSPYLDFDISYAVSQLGYKNRVVSVMDQPLTRTRRNQIPSVLFQLPMINLAEVGREEGFKRVAQALQGAA
jgi:hypothetical protein